MRKSPKSNRQSPAPSKTGETAPATEPRLVTMRTLAAEPGARYEVHGHPFDEFTLVTDDDTVIHRGGGLRPTPKNTLLLYRAGEQHGSFSLSNQRPRFWVVHFTVPTGFFKANLASPNGLNTSRSGTASNAPLAVRRAR